MNTEDKRLAGCTRADHNTALESFDVDLLAVPIAAAHQAGGLTQLAEHAVLSGGVGQPDAHAKVCVCGYVYVAKYTGCACARAE